MISNLSRPLFRPVLRSSAVVGLSCALSGATHLANAQNLPESPSISAAAQTVRIPGAAVTVRPGKSAYVTPDLRTAVIGLTETGGNLDMARRGLAASAAAISILPGYSGIPAREVSAAMQIINKDALRTPEYQFLKKKLKADRVLSVTLVPGDNSDAASTYTAIAELYDTTSGGLAGRSEKSYTATPDNANPARAAGSTLPAANIERGPLVDAPTGSLQERAVEGAVARAIFGLNDPIILRGVVLSKNAESNTKGAPLTTRISMGERSGLRVGAPIEYYSPNGQRLAFGTIIDLGRGESVATVAPEAAFANIWVNSEVVNIDNPPLSRAGKSQRSLDDREWRSFERQFGIALAITTGVYLLTK